MNPLERCISKLEAAVEEVEPIDFILRFVSTDGTPDRRCRLVDGRLVDVDEKEADRVES